ncbi:translation elongation factor Ts [candidate division WOR-3 bacterium]|nr:translation elongation factor Ts [candidate division WOR-3 bacterium]MCK4571859.1 translation elongation factor Ts [candidate division WOR-3 bacterium]
MASTKDVDIELIKKLRAKTNAGILDCKNALIESECDIDKAIHILREKGIAKATKKMGRETGEGVIMAYIHPGDQLGSLVELNCETDFVARTDEFKELAKEITMQVVAYDPIAVDRESIPKDIIEEERSIYEEQAKRMKKPEEVQKKIVESKLEKFYKDVVLLEQDYFRDPKVTIGDLVKEKISVIGENIVVRRFIRFQVGE